MGAGIGVGVVVLAGMLFTTLSPARVVLAGPLSVLVLSAWITLGVAALWMVERRKPGLVLGTPKTPQGWAAHVRELRSSRLEIVNAFEIERRRIERDLHDGAQQHLVAASLQIGEAALLLSDPDGPARAREALRLLDRAQDATDAALAALRATVAGIHPATLSDLGLEEAVRDLADRSAPSVEVRVPHRLPELPEGVAAAAYFFVAEALTNVAKHAPQAHATILLAADDDLRVSVVDNGPGGAAARTGHGLAGMSERLATFGGQLQISSPMGGPTSLSASMPLLLAAGDIGVNVEAPRPACATTRPPRRSGVTGR